MPDEKRTYRRVALEVEDGYFGSFRLADEETFAAPILSLSAGGLQLALPKAKEDLVDVGTRMYLKQLIGAVQLSFLADIYVEARWKKESDSPDYILVGCELLDLSDPLKDQVIKFVDAERKARGQYS